jgi:flagella basal body P-ring formation protein FlgA
MKMHDAAFLTALMCVATPGAHAQSSQMAQRSAQSTVQIPIAAHDLARGDVLTIADIAWTDTLASVIANGSTFRNGEHVAAGWVARRRIREGEILREPSVSRPDLVSIGDEVDVIYVAPGVKVKVHGTAVGSGADGDEVYVKLENRKRIRCIVTGINTVRVM